VGCGPGYDNALEDVAKTNPLPHQPAHTPGRHTVEIRLLADPRQPLKRINDVPLTVHRPAQPEHRTVGIAWKALGEMRQTETVEHS